jgi:hypothetical protein
MYALRVTHDFNFDCEKVFAGISDHAAFLNAKSIHCRLLQTGEKEANGVGAIREVRSGMFCFIETINAFHAPNFYEYRITTLHGPLGIKLPFHHALGRIELEAFDNTTRAVWVSHFHFAIPFFGSWLDRKLGAEISRTFLFFLKQLEQRLASSA